MFVPGLDIARMVKQSAFAGGHTIKKLNAIEGYLHGYQTVMKKQNFITAFFDAFAGTGDLPTGYDDGGLLADVVDKDEMVQGSARRALQVAPPFHRYIFVEKMKGKVEELLRVKAEFASLAGRIQVTQGDANEELVAFCKATDWRSTRAVVFLDPFGNQVRWETLEAIAKCPIDLWYLFPSHLGVNRQINNDGNIDATRGPSLDSLYGTPNWRDAFVRHEKRNDLFGETEVATKQVDADIATRFMIERMKTIFRGGVLDEWLPLGKNGAHWYSLIFACANPRGGEIARRIARHVVRRK
jgi:three-Cys-motif partner protein